MIVAMQEGADEALIQQVIEQLVKLGFEVHRSTGARMTVLGAVGSGIDFDIRNLELLPGVQEVHRISSPYKLAGRSFRPEGTIVKLANGIDVGGNEIVVMAGPCSVETREQIFTTAEAIGKAGAKVLRGGAFKPRSSPYSFQGHGEEALKLCESETPALAILDLVMPKLGGPETAAKLAARFTNLPVLFTSGYSQEAKGAENVGHAARYLQKPYSPSTLGRMVREILDQAKAMAPPE